MDHDRYIIVYIYGIGGKVRIVCINLLRNNEVAVSFHDPNQFDLRNQFSFCPRLIVASVLSTFN